jgi:type VI secretion system secreted protein VgrG
MGHLVQQGAHAGASFRGPWLGTGFYAHTDGWAVVRSQQGLLLSTSTRKAKFGSAQGTQMDAREAVDRIQAAQAVGSRLNEVLVSQGAAKLSSHDKSTEQALEGALNDIDPQLKGKYGAAVGLQSQFKSQPDSREPNTSEPVERFDKAHIVFETPSTVAQTSEGPVSSYSGFDTSLTAHRDIHVASAHTITSTSGQTTSIATNDGPLKLITANGNLSLAAHTDELEIIADGAVITQSANGEINISAKDKIELICGSSKIVLDGPNIDYYCMEFVSQAQIHDFRGPESGDADLPQLPDTRVKLFDEAFVIRDESTGQPLPGVQYRIMLPDGTHEEGVTDELGRTHVAGCVDRGNIKLQVNNY